MIVERRIYDTDLAHRAVSVFCYLCDRANRKGQCWPSTRTIALDLNMSRRTVFRALHDLEEKGFIKRVGRIRDAYSGSSSNLYQIEVVRKHV